MSDTPQDLDKLAEKIKVAKGDEPEETPDNNGAQTGIELVASIAVCTAIGYSIDQYFETKPLWLIIFLFLGVFVGFYNVYRTINNISPAVGYHKAQQNPSKGDLKQEPKDAKDEA